MRKPGRKGYSNLVKPPHGEGSGGPTFTRKNCAGQAAVLVSVHWKRPAAGRLVMKSVFQFSRLEDDCTA